jgi:hypothetical protein
MASVSLGDQRPKSQAKIWISTLKSERRWMSWRERERRQRHREISLSPLPVLFV